MSQSNHRMPTIAQVAVRCLSLLLLLAPAAHARAPQYVDRGNQRIANFDHAKVQLRILYAERPITLYSNCAYTTQLTVDYNHCAYVPRKNNARAQRIEWEHVVPAEAFGQNFTAWREGDPQCTDSHGRPYKGRRCAQKVSAAYRRMEGDLYNLYPEIGELNQIRSNHPMDAIDDAAATLAPLTVRSTRKAFMPREEVLGDVARTYLYMQDAYPGLRIISARRRQLYLAWSAQDPVDAWECRRAWRIAALQGNTNRIVQRACLAAGLWPTPAQPEAMGGADLSPDIKVPAPHMPPFSALPPVPNLGAVPRPAVPPPPLPHKPMMPPVE